MEKLLLEEHTSQSLILNFLKYLEWNKTQVVSPLSHSISYIFYRITHYS